MKLLYYSPSSYGGLADYAHEQANALVEVGVEVDLLCMPNYPTDKGHQYTLVAQLKELDPDKPIKTKTGRVWRYINTTLTNYRTLSATIKRGAYKYVLMGSYAEYLSPLWARQLCHLAGRGVVFGAVVHDPVRDFVLGPAWWHRWSVSRGYAYLSNAFVHEHIALDTGTATKNLTTTVIPHGLYRFPHARRSASLVRQDLNIPQQAKVILSFGHIRDGKNLDLILHAMVKLPQVYLIVAGKEQSSGQRPASFYQRLAESLDVANRCRWEVGFVSEEVAADLFTASDIVALTYSRIFRSASGVLGVAANYQKQCIASGGEGALKETVKKYGLGTWVEPDSYEAIHTGLKQQLYKPPQPHWNDYYADNSWLMNAQKVVNALKSTRYKRLSTHSKFQRP
ncbi:MAG: glycosyltransferase family 4 protein [Cyanobacteria bacterium J06560_6]